MQIGANFKTYKKKKFWNDSWMENDISFLTFFYQRMKIFPRVQYNNIIVFEIISNYTSWYASMLYLKICYVGFLYTNFYIWILLYWFLVLRSLRDFIYVFKFALLPSYIEEGKLTLVCASTFAESNGVLEAAHLINQSQ